ncbi:hypothetical protein AAKU67_001666 [Oxalobacteraceae bacterium GrIS 2.11]
MADELPTQIPNGADMKLKLTKQELKQIIKTMMGIGSSPAEVTDTVSHGVEDLPADKERDSTAMCAMCAMIEIGYPYYSMLSRYYP